MTIVPTYEYTCDDCRHHFERFQSIKARPLRVCPKCGRSRLKRLIGAGAGVIFKGSGFYQTDYRSESYKKAEKKEKDSAETKSGEKETKTEAKDKQTKKQTKQQATDEKKSV